MWQAMKSVYYIIIWNGRDPGTSELSHHQPHQRLLFIQRRFCCIYGGVGETSIMSAFWKNQMINSNKYCSQLGQLKAAFDEKHPVLVDRKCIIFHQDMARLHVSLKIRQKLLQLDWEVLIHLLYSPDIAASDSHLFQSLQNSPNGKNFNSLEDYTRHLEQFFSKKNKFWSDGIMKLS